MQICTFYMPVCVSAQIKYSGLMLSAKNRTRTVLVFVKERTNNVDPRLRLQKKVNNIQLFFTKLTGVHLMCQIFMNDLLTEQGQQRSRVIR